MTRKTFAPVLVSLAAMLALAGCGGGGLSADGSAIVRDSTGTESGFRFPGSVRLDGGAGTTTGTCTISRGAGGVYGVVLDLYGDAQGEGHAVRSFSLMTHTATVSTGQITADLGGDEFTGECDVDVSNLDTQRGNVTIIANDCALTHETETATANVVLSLAGCSVI